MSAYAVLNLLIELGKRDKMWGLLSNLSPFPTKLNKLNNTGAQMLYSFYHKTTVKSHFCMKKLRFCPAIIT